MYHLHTRSTSMQACFPPPTLFPFVLCFLHLINRFTLLCIFYFHSFNDCDGDDESSLIIIVTTFFFFSYLFTLCYFIVFHPFSPYPRFPFYSWDAGRFFIFYFWRLACAITFFSFFFSTTTNLHHHHQQQVYQVSNPVVLPPGVFY